MKGRRDPKRIGRVLAGLEKVWEKHPDLRLGQLLIALDPKYASNCFNIEDSRLEALLDIVDVRFDGNLGQFVETARDID